MWQRVEPPHDTVRHCFTAGSNADKLEIWKDDGRERITVDSPGVDANFIGEYKWPDEGGMPENHALAEILLRVDELLPDPDQIVRGLFLKGNAVSKPGVDHDKLRRFVVQAKIAKEPPVTLGPSAPGPRRRAHGS